jgi:hypothetical protein
MVGAEVDLRDVLAGLEGMGRRAKDLRKVFAELKAPMRADINKQFASESGPEGSWPAWSESYAEKIRGTRAGKGAERIPLSSEANKRRRSRRLYTRADGRLSARGIKKFTTGMLGRVRSAWKFLLGPDFLEARWLFHFAGVLLGGGRVGHGATIPARRWGASADLVKIARDRILRFVVRGT